jgi:hypothetical protein
MFFPRVLRTRREGGLIGIRKSTHVNKRAMTLLADSPKKHTRELKLLKYIASLVDFYVFQQKGRGKLPPLSKAKSSFHGTSPALLEGFYSKFTETVSGQFKKDEDGKIKDSNKSVSTLRLREGQANQKPGMRCRLDWNRKSFTTRPCCA